jgi:hypothetical protein
MHAGPEIGNILRSLEDEWRANDFAASRDELLAALTDLKMDKG